MALWGSFETHNPTWMKWIVSGDAHPAGLTGGYMYSWNYHHSRAEIGSIIAQELVMVLPNWVGLGSGPAPVLQLQVTSITALMATADLKGAEYREAYGEAAWSQVLGTYSMTLGGQSRQWFDSWWIRGVTTGKNCDGVLTWEHPPVVKPWVWSVVRRSSVPLIHFIKGETSNKFSFYRFFLSAVTRVIERLLTHQQVWPTNVYCVEKAVAVTHQGPCRGSRSQGPCHQWVARLWWPWS